MPHYLSLMHRCVVFLKSSYLKSIFFFRTIMLCYLLVTMEWSPCHWQRASDWPGAGLIDCGCLPDNISEEHASRCSSTTHTYVNTPCLTFGCDKYLSRLLLFILVKAPQRPQRKPSKEADSGMDGFLSFVLIIQNVQIVQSSQLLEKTP